MPAQKQMQKTRMARLKRGHDCLSRLCQTPRTFHSAGTMPRTRTLASFRRIVVTARAVSIVGLTLGLGAMPATAQSGRPSCEDICAKRCAQKEMAPGLYRMECEIHCVPICYANKENGTAPRGGGGSK